MSILFIDCVLLVEKKLSLILTARITLHPISIWFHPYRESDLNKDGVSTHM